VKIIVADDHAFTRMGLQAFFDRRKDMTVAAEASSFHELEQKLRTETYDFLILDLNLGDLNGLKVIEAAKAIAPALPILVLSSSPEELYAINTIRSGADGFLNKAILSDEIVLAVETIMAGRKYVSQGIAENLPFGLLESSAQETPFDVLSEREHDVLALLTSGMRYKEIAEQLSLSQKTVSTYRARIMEKLNLSTTSELIRFALENRIQHA